MTNTEIKIRLEKMLVRNEQRKANKLIPADILDIKDIIKQLSICDVVRMLVCVDGVLPNLTEGKEYEMLEETNRHYNLIDDNGNDVLIGKSCMRELKQAN